MVNYPRLLRLIEVAHSPVSNYSDASISVC